MRRARSSIQSWSDCSRAIKHPLSAASCDLADAQTFYEATQIHSEDQQDDHVCSVTEVSNRRGEEERKETGMEEERGYRKKRK